MGTILSIKKVGIAIGLLAVLAGCSHTGGAGDTTKGGDSSAKRGQMVALTNAKTTAKYFDALVDIEVKNVTLDFFQEGALLGSDLKEDGKQLVRVEFMVTNKGKEAFDVNSTAFRLVTSTEKEGDTYYIFVDSKKLTDIIVPEGMTSKTLQAGESASGALYFEAPATDTLENLSFSYEGYDGDTKFYTIPFKT